MPITVCCQGKFKTYCKQRAASWTAIFTAGALDGGVEVLRFHYDKVDSKLNLNDQFWNPNISHTNKYKNGDPSQGEAYFGSTTFLIASTDGYHLLRFFQHQAIIAGAVFSFRKGQKWWMYTVDIVVCTVIYCIGFNLSYELWKL